MIPSDFVDSLLQKVDIINVVGQHVNLKKSGSNYLGLCPFHGEKSPSFTVSPNKNFYHCFGCGASGNAINFLKNYLGLNYVESVTNLAQSIGVNVPNNIKNNDNISAKKANNPYYLQLQEVSLYYQQQLKNNEQAIQYLKTRGLTGIVAKKFALGYAPNEWQNLSNIGNKDVLITTGMLINKNNKIYDRFRGRIMFPIRNKDGNIIAYGGRVIGNEQPKYLNSPETILFNKSQTLYGLFENQEGIKKAKKALIVEGYMDVVALHQHNIDYAVATLGTSFTVEHINILFKHTEHVIFAFDGDIAGKNAAVRALEKIMPILKDDKTIEFMFLPYKHDPDSYIRTLGIEPFQKAINQAIPLSKFLIHTIINGYNLQIAEERAKIQVKANYYLDNMPNIFLKKQIQQTLWGLTSAFNKTRDNAQNKWQSPEKATKNNILQPIEKLMQSLFIQPLLASIICEKTKVWINYAYSYMTDFWLECINLYKTYEKEQYSEFWLNSSYKSYYIKLCTEYTAPLKINDELFIEENIKLAQAIAEQGINLKKHNLLKQIEIKKKINQNFEQLLQEFNSL